MTKRMMALAIASTLVSFAAATTTAAQTMTFGGGKDNLDRRESTWISYFDQGDGRFIGGFAINYNKVAWQERYAKELDTILRGSIWRMGKHFWSTLDSNLALNVGGVDVSPGYYYLGLSRDEAGTFQLAVIDATKAQESRLDAFNIADADVTHRIPLALEQSESLEKEDELTILFLIERSDGSTPYENGIVTDVVLTIAFGDVRLTAPIGVTPPSVSKS